MARGDTDSRSATDRVVPTWTEPLAAGGSTPFGGRLGRHAVIGRHWFWTPLRVCLLLAVATLALGWFTKAACAQQFFNEDSKVLELDWRSNRPFAAMCYSDIVPLYSAERLDKGGFPYRTLWIDDEGKPTAHVRYMEYPVLTGLFQWVNAKLAQGWVALADSPWVPNGLPVVIYFDISAFWLALAWLATVWAVLKLAGRRPWDAALVAVSPLVAVHAFTNFDTLATACAAAGLLAWARRRPVLAGVLLGIGGAAKLYPLFLLGPLLVLCVRARKVSVWQTTALTAGFTWVAVNFPIWYAYRDGWWEFFRRNALRGADPDSIYNVISQFTGWAGFDGPLGFQQSPSVLNAVSALLFVACCAGVTFIALHAPVRPRIASLSFLVVAAFLLTNKVWSPQYSLWLVPLAVLAVPRWKPLLAWMAIDALVWVPRMMFYLGVDPNEGKKGLPVEWFMSAVVLRDLVVIGLCVLVVYEIYHPARDLVRAGGVDDPAGGVLDGAPDRFTLNMTRRRSAVGQPADELQS
ncbi:glycosyltransferase family 87 protein [Actinophytocola sp.]|uniref:glycosyltransferase family 87 protein n=1 Tax=Actinophytocola sp. TaxID=1872138 RepID=UPI002D7F5785|nr:glycosyltransferase 87 family protein [Actinophytocola sp.]HET9142151.1 glycosyltransferase 87 family protein [Actinophytocola sp.]